MPTSGDPQLKSITLGGATVSCGIRRHRPGMVWCTKPCRKWTFLLADGSVALCAPTNERRDLFHSFSPIPTAARLRITEQGEGHSGKAVRACHYHSGMPKPGAFLPRCNGRTTGRTRTSWTAWCSGATRWSSVSGDLLSTHLTVSDYTYERVTTNPCSNTGTTSRPRLYLYWTPTGLVFQNLPVA